MAGKSRAARFFQRERLPGDLAFSIVFLLFCIFLISQLGEQAVWAKRTRLFAQPAFWPTVSLAGMLLFSLLHCFGSWVSPRTPGRGAEVLFWIRSLEYSAWFLLYVWTVPRFGYLGTTLLFTLILTYRAGYRKGNMLVGAALMGVGIVVVFKSLLQVKIPSGQLYEFLPDGIRNFMLVYL
ncbi:MAG: tripartite tricarboxylate transporter TctB family protein [Gammaproteobacteria bacterium]|nr:tripartite tricarboxylate transporter TctB family protein [Gammaproteobacteria bacterium]